MEIKNKKERLFRISLLVREAGVEPARPCEHRHLKPASLPIPPLAQAVDVLSLRTGCILPRGTTSVNNFFEKIQTFFTGRKSAAFFSLTEGGNGAMLTKD